MDTIRCYTIDEAADILKVYPNTLRGYVKKGIVNAVKIGGRYRITEDELKRLLGEAAPAHN